MLSTELLALFSNIGHYLRGADSYRVRSTVNHETRQHRQCPSFTTESEPPGLVLRPVGCGPVGPVRIGHRDARGVDRPRRDDGRWAWMTDRADVRRGCP